MRSHVWATTTCLFSICLAGCSALPGQGPYAAQVLREADPASTPAPRFLVTELSPYAVSVLDSYPRPTFIGRFNGPGRAPASVIGVGDMVQVTVWEAASGGLFSSTSINGITAGSHSASVPEQAVSRDGTITVPYAGTINAVGQTPHEVEEKIVQGLTSKAIEPQALVTITHNASNTATVLGEVTNGARVPLSVRGDRILDVIATAGGIRAPAHEVFISLSRGNRTARVPMQALISNPRENIYVHAGDVITVVHEPQTFTAFGATGQNALVPFDAIGLSLEEAVAKAGGLLDRSADPQGVFLMRTEPADIAARLDPHYPIPAGATSVNVVYHINLKDADTYFLARHFAMRNKDVMYVANSASTELSKALEIFGTLTSPALSGAYLIK